ncbi:MAG: L,D-transpeptidase, partial [Tabrizicola sp.]
MKITRRSFVVTGLAATLPFPALGHTQTAEDWVTPEEFLPRPVRFQDRQEPGTIIVDPDYFALYLAVTERKGMQYS